MVNGVISRLSAILALVPAVSAPSAVIDSSPPPLPGILTLADSIRREIHVLNKNPSASSNTSYFISLFNALLAAPPPVSAVNASFQSVKVDIVADAGRQWIRILSITPPRLTAELDQLSDSDPEDIDIDATSLLKSARLLLDAARCAHSPQVVFRLTRLARGQPRVDPVLDRLEALGILLLFGEEQCDLDPRYFRNPNAFKPTPTTSIALDLSILIALISDTTHAPLSQNEDRFEMDGTSAAISADPIHARALSSQLRHERRTPLIPLIYTTLKTYPPTFYTTSSTLHLFQSIVSKVAGRNEQRRADALLSVLQDQNETKSVENMFWKDSRFEHDSRYRGLGFTSLNFYPYNPHPPNSTNTEPTQNLTAHTLELIHAARRQGHTVLTANRKSVRALREDKLRVDAKGDVEATFWIVEPRSLAEKMRLN